LTQTPEQQSPFNEQVPPAGRQHELLWHDHPGQHGFTVSQKVLGGLQQYPFPHAPEQQSPLAPQVAIASLQHLPLRQSRLDTQSAVSSHVPPIATRDALHKLLTQTPEQQAEFVAHVAPVPAQLVEAAGCVSFVGLSPLLNAVGTGVGVPCSTDEASTTLTKTENPPALSSRLSSLTPKRSLPI